MRLLLDLRELPTETSIRLLAHSSLLRDSSPDCVDCVSSLPMDETAQLRHWTFTRPPIMHALQVGAVCTLKGLSVFAW